MDLQIVGALAIDRRTIEIPTLAKPIMDMEIDMVNMGHMVVIIIIMATVTVMVIDLTMEIVDITRG